MFLHSAFWCYCVFILAMLYDSLQGMTGQSSRTEMRQSIFLWHFCKLFDNRLRGKWFSCKNLGKSIRNILHIRNRNILTNSLWAEIMVYHLLDLINSASFLITNIHTSTNPRDLFEAFNLTQSYCWEILIIVVMVCHWLDWFQSDRKLIDL